MSQNKKKHLQRIQLEGVFKGKGWFGSKMTNFGVTEDAEKLEVEAEY